MDDLISRQAAIDEIKALYEWHDTVTEDRTIDHLKRLPTAQPDNQTNLCDSCNYSYPDCPSKNDDVIFGNGIGNDNICACNKYKPSAQPEPRWIPCGDSILIKGVKMPKGCVYEGENGKTEYCFLCNHADVPFCMYLEWEPEAAIGIDERPVYCPILPSAQPEPSEDDPRAEVYYLAEEIGIHQLYDLVVKLRGEPEPCEDTISRQAVKEWLAKWEGYIDADIIARMQYRIIDVPSAQPDLVRCNECEYGAQDEVGRWFCRSLGCQIGNEDGSGYCADAERRTND